MFQPEEGDQNATMKGELMGEREMKRRIEENEKETIFVSSHITRITRTAISSLDHFSTIYQYGGDQVLKIRNVLQKILSTI